MQFAQPIGRARCSGAVSSLQSAPTSRTADWHCTSGVSTNASIQCKDFELCWADEANCATSTISSASAAIGKRTCRIPGRCCRESSKCPGQTQINVNPSFVRPSDSASCTRGHDGSGHAQISIDSKFVRPTAGTPRTRGHRGSDYASISIDSQLVRPAHGAVHTSNHSSCERDWSSDRLCLTRHFATR